MTEEVTASVEPETTVETVEEAQVATTETTETPEEDMSWVPAKFLVDGKPDYKNLAKSYQNLETKIGKKGALAPSSVDEYVYEPQGIEFDSDKSSAFKEEAMKAGISPEQYQFIMSKYESVMTEMMPSEEKTSATLKEDWGKDFNVNLKSAQRAFENYAPSDVSKDDPIFNHPTVMKILANIGADLGEDTTPAKAGSTNSTISQEKVDELMNSPDYWNNMDKQKMVRQWFEKSVG